LINSWLELSHVAQPADVDTHTKSACSVQKMNA
jgi:hypothetical protein